MSKFILLLIVATSVFGAAALACPGGHYELNKGNVVLYGDRVFDKRAAKDYKSSDLLNQADKSFEGTRIEVIFVKADADGVIGTWYKVKQPGKKETVIRVNTNYHGNGRTTRSLPPAEPKFDLAAGC